MPRTKQQDYEYHEGEKKTTEDLLARDLHFAWLKYSIGMLYRYV